MKRQHRTIRAIIAILPPNGYQAYRRILKNATYAFYDFVSKDDNVDYKQILLKDILFIIAAFDNIITSGHWEKVYKAPVEPELEILPNKYVQDILNPGIFFIYDANSGKMFPASKEECAGLEDASVWGASEVEDRLMKHFFPK